MPTPMPIIAASCGDQSTTSSRRVPITAISAEAHDHREQGVEQRQPHGDHAERQEQHERRDEQAEDLAGAALLGRRPVDDVAAERDLDAALAVERERVLGHRLDRRGVGVAAALAQLDLGERDPAVLGDRRALGERIADGQHLGRLRDLLADRLDLRALVEDLALLDREDDAGGVAGLRRELLLEQVVGPLGLRARQVEVVDELTGGGGPQSGGDEEGGDPEADHGAAPVMAPGGERTHGADAIPLSAPGRRCNPNPVRGVIRSLPGDTGATVQSAGAVMEFRVLGPLEVRDGDRAVVLGGAKPRAVLAQLLVHANEVVSAERLALGLWGEDAPAGAVKTVQVHVARLRRALGEPEALATAGAGYRLRVEPGELDADRFEALVAKGREALAAGDAGAGEALREALALWRGPPLSDLAAAPFAPAEIARLEEQRLEALELRVQADLDDRAPRRADRRARPAHARAPAARAPACAADARAVPQRAPGRRAGRLPAGARGARRRPRGRAGRGARRAAACGARTRPCARAAAAARRPGSGAAEPDRRPCDAARHACREGARGAAADADRAGRGRQDPARDRGRAHE